MKSLKQPGVLLLACAAAYAQAQAPIADRELVEVKGKIARVQIAAGQGMPYLEIETRPKATKVLLGSMRYLMEQNFSPKAGEEVQVRGYRLNDLVVAITVKPVGEGKTLVLRDEKGWPVWMRGGPGAGRGCCRER
jgi:hypothetical protein